MARRVAIGVLVVGGFYFAWQVVSVFLMVFAAILVAVGLHSLATPFARLTRIREQYAVFPVALMVLAGLVLVGYQFGSTIQTQVSQLIQDLPTGWKEFESRFHLSEMMPELLQRAEAAAPPSSVIITALQSFTTNLVQVLVGLFLVVVGGLYFAVDPALYRKLFLALWSEHERPRILSRMTLIAEDLRSFLKAQVIAMIVVGVLTFIGLTVLGIPSALALALFASLAEFVPMVGPVVAAIPALLIALTLGLDSALWTLAMFVAVQQTESNLITPVLQQRMVSLPPAVTLFAVVLFGSLFGPLGILLATPLTVLVFASLRDHHPAQSKA
ncbi:AI-2E family transporter [Xanthobacter agilis]|uniref:PurR-regulated permease PerM n=1 Tax=Xanthobacter agilis TaxID=47492 RepID=A0ABU0LBK3_XANAG|nr:AI-2E family transporter [Xanthobacter agilis]MDQ0504513.1 putative PurR-regulated permease PerM [Xanthobacter agilis]